MGDNKTCKYHPEEPSSWNCSHCDIAYCRTCIPGSVDNYRGKPKCPMCNYGLEFLGASNTAEPFWSVPHRFFAYPFQKDTLMVIGLMTLAGWFMTAGLLTLFLSLFLIVGFIRYGLKVVQYYGAGDSIAPPLGDLGAQSGEYIFLKQVGIFVAFGFMVYLAGQVHPAFAAVVAFLLNLMMPASIMTLAQTNELGKAINPLYLTVIILKIGASYLALLLGVFTVSSGPGLILSLVGESLPVGIVLPLLFLMFSYFSLVTYAMMGYVIYEKQAVLGFSVVMDDDEFYLDDDEFERQQLLATSNIYFHEGRYEEARKLLLEGSDKYRNDMEYNDRLHKLFMILDDRKSLVNHTNFYCESLVKQGFAGKAVTVYLDAQSKEKKFQLDTALASLEVAKLLFQQTKYMQCIILLNGFHKRFPKSKSIAEAYTICARAFSEGLNDDAKAAQLTAFVKKLRAQEATKKQSAAATSSPSASPSEGGDVPRDGEVAPEDDGIDERDKPIEFKL